MSVFEQCLPYKELGLDKDLTCDVLEDDEDILTQISAQLDIPSFADQEVTPQTGNYNNSLHGSFLPPIEGLESGMLDDVLMDDFSNNYNYPDSGFSDGSIKSEPCSPGSSSQDQSPPLSPVMEYSLVTSVNTILSQPMAINTVNSMINIPTTVNGKVAIPKLNKPLMTPAPLVTSTVTNNTANPPPLVLVCNQPPSNGPIIVKTETVPSTGYCNPLITGLPTVTGHSSAEDLRNLKRQQRMIKNRESACISRKKKKEYVTQLEDQIKTLSSENQLLRNENENLKEKLRDLQAEKSLWTDSIIRSSSNKKATAVLALLFMVSLNMNSLSGIYNSEDNNNNVDANLNKNVHKREAGRTLLWVDDSLDNNNDNDREFLGNITADSSQCGGSNLNQTESIRLESDLRGWFNIDPPRNKRRPDVTRRPTRSPKKKAERRISNSAVGNVVRTPLHSLTGSVYHMLAPPSSQQQNALSFYSNQPRNSFASFFDAIDRRDDTFYVVSFSGDHLLVPATNHTKTTRPLMSLLLPAVVSSNSTTENQSDTIAMMKIDCQVINTQMVHITKDAIPVHMASNLKEEQNTKEKNFDNDKVYATNFKKNASRTADNGIFVNNPKKTFEKSRKFDAN